MFGKRQLKLSILEQAQQDMYRLRSVIWREMESEEADKWLCKFGNPDPWQDWLTGAELGDPCPVHGKEINALTPSAKMRMMCEDCDQDALVAEVGGYG